MGTFLLIVFGGVLLATVLRVSPFFRNKRPPSPPFDMTQSRLGAEAIVSAGMPKDGMQALHTPGVLQLARLDSLNRDPKKKYVMPGDLVIGVALGGAARAYPVGVLNWHEVVNDTLGGIPIVVSWNPLSGCAVVYDRRVGGERLQFGVSGLLYNSNLLMYDRREGGEGESLWSQLLGCAVTGPAAGREEKLIPLPASLTGWEVWRDLFPGTSIIDRDPAKIKLYKKKPYTTYYTSRKLRFPAEPLPEDGGIPLKAPVVALSVGGEEHVYSVEGIAGRAGPRGVWETEVGGERVEFRWVEKPRSVIALSGETALPLPAVYSFWFARYAMHPETELE